MHIQGIDHIEFYVGNALQSAYYYQHALGFEPIAYKGPESGCKDTVSYVLKQGDIVLVFTAPLLAGHPINKFLQQHGDAVSSIAFGVEDAKVCWQIAIDAGATATDEPIKTSDKQGNYISATVKAYGDVTHQFVERHKYKGPFAPGYIPLKSQKSVNQIGFTVIDHCTSNVGKGELGSWIGYYHKIFGFSDFIEFDENAIKTDYSALTTKVVASDNLSVKLPLIQPVDGIWKSQINEFVDFNSGPGVQHLAFCTEDIFKTVVSMKTRGAELLEISEMYYEDLKSRLPEFSDSIAEMQENNIMVDSEGDGYIFQAFSKPLQDRPTFFIEIVERKGARAFGKNNVSEFFQALTREQNKRGNI